MSSGIVVGGTVKADGTLELDGKLTMAPGRVQVAVHPLVPKQAPDLQRFWAMMQGIWLELSTGGHQARTREDIDDEINALREEAEEEMQTIEQSRAKASDDSKAETNDGPS